MKTDGSFAALTIQWLTLVLGVGVLDLQHPVLAAGLVQGAEPGHQVVSRADNERSQCFHNIRYLEKAGYNISPQA